MPKPVGDILRDMTGSKSAIVPDLNDAPPLGVTAVDLQHRTDWRKIIRLNSSEHFLGLFAKCDACGLIMAFQVFCYHDCRPLGVDGLELTNCEE